VDPLPSVEDDGLYTPEVGEWAERKYRLIAYYAEMFATSMKDKWASRVYMDLFAGAGRGRIKDSSRIITTSALLALEVRNPFDRYVFCDIEPDCIAALQERVRRSHPDRDVRYLTGDANGLVEPVLRELPPHRLKAGVLSFCVLDPFNLGNLQFSTVKRLSTIFVDFLVLIPSYMDANRNERAYTAAGNSTVADFLGNPGWRLAWSEVRGEFGNFVVDQFGQSMKRLGFIYDGPGDEVLFHLPRKNVKLYHLVFYSKSELGMRFWRQARKYSDPQMDLFE
jgi:three-Cys-motif partner protein